jgi:hypothetical protein
MIAFGGDEICTRESDREYVTNFYTFNKLKWERELHFNEIYSLDDLSSIGIFKTTFIKHLL